MSKWVRVMKFFFLTIAVVILITIGSYAEINIDKEIEELSKIKDLTISDFIELIDENDEYEILAIDMREGLNYPTIIKNNDLKSIKKVIEKEKGISESDINEAIYPNLFKEYNIKFVKNKDKEFAVFRKSKMVTITYSDKSDDLQVGINGDIKDISMINQLQRGQSYDLVFYKDGDKLGNIVVDLIDFNGEEYEVKVPEKPINLGMIVVMIVIVIVIVALIVYRKYKGRKQEEINGVNDEEYASIELEVLQETSGVTISPVDNKIEYININQEIINICEILQNDEYENKIKRNVIDVLKEELDEIKQNKIDIVNYNRARIIQINSQKPSKEIKEKVDKADELTRILESRLEIINDKITQLNDDLYSIKGFEFNMKIQRIKNIASDASRIYVNIDKRKFELDDIAQIQRQIIFDYDEENTYVADIDRKYSNIIENYNVILKQVFNYLMSQSDKMDEINFKCSQIEVYLKSLDERVENLFDKINKDTLEICKTIQNNKKSMNSAIERFDSTINVTLNENIKLLSEYIDGLKDNINKEEIKDIIASYEKRLEKALDCKYSNLEKMQQRIIESSYKVVDVKDYLSVDSIKRIDSDTLDMLTTAETLYINMNELLINDYSCIFIMYSKVLELELSKK